MVRYRRNKPDNSDAIFFFTIVTKNRSPWIDQLPAYDLLLSEMNRLSEKPGFEILAWVILPDHIHWLIQPLDNDYSDIITAFKRGIGAELKRSGFLEKGGKLWQDRFWEETIRDDKQYENCLDYIHFNPVKHRLVPSPVKWPHSSFHHYVAEGIYSSNWADGEKIVVKGAEYD